MYGDRWRDMLSEEPLHSRIVALAADEAHCVYKWGSDFRPTYARVHEVMALIPSGTPMVAATTTVTKIMGMHLAALNTVILDGIPHSLENSSLEFGRASRSGEQLFLLFIGALRMLDDLTRSTGYKSIWRRSTRVEDYSSCSTAQVNI